ncbi:hypothetical protein RJ640_021652 [Escallonia rubra]|uniref:Uncharacterized protein n=1 Tax=Escallonia rubra TaxID=112253 RepID=A0AA88U670_9ASTE|nr:hypothetical protein RJ640_021652 [Escallonia rubra]
MAEENRLHGNGNRNLDEASTSRSPAALEMERDAGPNGVEENKNTVPFYKLFAFADSNDLILMIVGTIGGIGNGACMPIMTLLFGQLVDSFGQAQENTDVVHKVSKVSLKFVYLAMGAGVAAFLQVACWMVTGERQAARIRNLYLKTILRQDVAFFDKETNTGEVVGRMSGDTVLIQDAMGEKVGKFVQLVSTFVGGFVIAFVRGWLLTLVMLSSIPPLVLAGAIMSLFITKMSSYGQLAYAKAAIVVEQTVGSIRTVASFTGEKQAVSNYNNALVNAYKSGIREALAAGIGLGTIMLIVFSSYSLAVWYGAKMILEKGYTGGEVLNVIVAVLTGSMSLGQASPCMSAFAAGKAAAFKMFETINRKPEIDAYDTSGKILDDIRGDIELRDVCFSYPARPDEQIFSGFSLSIRSGTTAALVGQSGSGKSTVISLIERFYDPHSGEVLIDGINLKEFQLKWIREKIGLVSQEPVLFTCSIRDNIAYGKDGATTEEIRAATELANAAKFIDKLPQGLDTMVGEHGAQLSGGQKQRIAIARAILKNPRILLLDEATSALDAESERVVQEALDRIMVNRTTVIVAHRLTTVRNADMIAVIHRGKMVEKGSHSELLKDPEGAYSQLVRLQEVNGKSEQGTDDHDKSETSMEYGRQSSQRLSYLHSLSHGSSGRRNSSSRRSLSVSFGLPTSLSVHQAADPEAPPLQGLEKAPKVPLRRLAYLNKPEVPVLALGVIAAIINGAILPIFGILISSMIKTFYEPPHKLRKDSKFWALMFLLLGLISFLAHPLRSYFFALAGCKLIRRIRTMCFEKVVRMEVSWFDEPENSSGAIGARLSADAATVRALVGDALGQLVQDAASAAAGLAIAFQACWQLALIILALIPLIGVNGYIQLKFSKGFSADAKLMYEEASQVANDAVGSIRTVASFCAEEKVMELYRKKCEGPMKTGIRQGLISGIGFGASFSLLFCVYATSFYAGARLVEDGKTTFSNVFRVFFALTMASVAISSSSSFAPDSNKAKNSAASIFAMLDRKSKIDPCDESGTTLENVKGEIELRHITFKYPNRPHVQILRDLSLTIRSGQTAALVGESGSGKSTVISLLQRFYDPDSGHITLDGIDIQKLQLRWLRQQMGLVSQEPVLFNDTIRANIAYGKEDGNATEAEILAAAELANAHKFISGLQQGYDTVVGERGVQLSGGQKQRVAIARAIVKSPKILLLDEATSALDAESERVVQDALDRVMMNRTTVVVAHRLSTIKGADGTAHYTYSRAAAESGIRNPPRSSSSPEKQRNNQRVNNMAELENGLNGNTNMHEASASRSHALETEAAERSSGMNGGQQDLEKTKEKEVTNTIPFYRLFSFADSTDIILMIAGTTGAIGNGICLPLMTIIFGELVDSFGQTQNNKDIVRVVSKVALKFVYLAMGAGAAAFLQVACWMVTGERQAARIRSLYLKTILRQDVAFFDKETNTGEVVGRMSGDTVLIQDAMGEKVGKFIQLVSTFLGGFVIAFFKGWLLSLVMLSAIPPLVVAGGAMSLIIARMASIGQNAYAKAATIVEQTIGSIRTVASFTGERQAVINYNKTLIKAYKSGVQEGLAAGLGFGALMGILFLSYALAIWFGAKMILEKGYTGGEVINVILAVLTGSMSLGQASPCMSAFAAGQAAAFKMFETIKRKPEIDAYDTKGKVLDDIRGDIELKQVYFSYPARPDEEIFSGFSLSIGSGTTAALVGQSGSGKSTVISLIERFYDPQAGEVLIDGINLKDFQLKWIRGKIGLVSQEPVLFASSIKDNIAYGKDGATTEEIRAAAELANAAKFVDKLPQGLDTMVGEHGTQLSGGQKQRVAIARAILKDPRILLLDEATSALDAESERVVQEALDRIMVNRTTVIVAHRLSTVRNANMIAVIHRGKMVEKGSHLELLKDPEGAYSQLIRLQEVQKDTIQEGADDQDKSDITKESGRHSSQRISYRRSISRGSSVGNSSRHSFSVSFGVPTGFGAPETALTEPESTSQKISEKAAKVPLKRLASLNKPEIPVLILGAIAAIINGTIFPIFGILISSILKTFYEPPHQLRKDSKFWALMFVVLGLASFLAYPARSYFFAVAGCKLIRRIRSMCFEKVVHMEVSWFDEPENSSGAIGARLSADAATVRALVGDALAQLVQDASSAVAGLGIAFQACWQLALIVLALLPLIGLNGYVQIKFMKGFSADAKMMYEEASQVANDAVGSIRTVASFCAEEKVMELYRKKCEGPMKTGIRQGLISGIGFGASFALLFLVYATSFYAGARLVEDGKTTFSKVFRVFFALTMAAIAISQSSSMGPDSSKAKTSAASIFAILDRKSKIDPSDESGMTLENVKGEIELRHLSFRYPSRPDIQILRDLSLTIHSGKTVALVGESGCGKSTVISLLQRFYDPDSGVITLDGVEIQKLQLKWLRQQMGLVSQEPVLFNDTIRANIAYGKDDGNATEAEILAASELTNAHKFISGLQQGYDTVVGERGVQLSGGQKQRVAIARAIVKSPKILLLDEATSALDAESERVVQDALDRVIVNRTTVVVAHRLSTIKGADVIAVVKNGVIVEKGKHEALINIKDGFYASLVALHMSAAS